jgi:hypothetical protein
MRSSTVPPYRSLDYSVIAVQGARKLEPICRYSRYESAKLPNSRTIDPRVGWRMSTYPDAAVTKLRTIVAVIEQEIVQVPPTPALRAAWAELVEVLALGPAPQTRECPACHGIGMRTASRCGHCWASLPLLPALEG